MLGVVSPSQTTFIAFDLSSIPPGLTGSSISKATLKLYVSSVSTAGSFNVDMVNGSWSEATLTANNAPAVGGWSLFLRHQNDVAHERPIRLEQHF
jgi:hypothetical protein